MAWQRGPLRVLGVLLGVVLFAPGCGTLKRAAMRSVTGMFTGSDSSNVFVQDDDPELVREAMPFALKTYETLLQADPQNRQLYLATGSGFIQYANAFVQSDAERLQDEDHHRAQALKQRAKRLYLRGRDYALSGLELSHENFAVSLREDADATLAKLDAGDVPLLYWAAAGWTAAISVAPGEMTLVADLGLVEKMMRRALELDETFDHGAVHEFFIAFEAGRSEAMGGDPERAQTHFERTIELTEGRTASPYVTLANTLAVGKQDYALFKDLLTKALAIDPDAVPEWRLANTLAQEKARWLLGRASDLFIEYEEE